jgi:hypothetical protein
MRQNGVTRVVVSAAIIALIGVTGCAGASTPRKTLQAFSSEQQLADLFIEALGTHAVVIGTDGKDLHFTSLRLGPRAETTDRYARANAAKGETRSHGFYYRQQSEHAGLIGQPIIGGGQAAQSQLRRESASLLYLRNRSLRLTEVGTLESRPDAAGTNDGCVASCVDWYGNSQPLFVRDRIFALLGYEIVEGKIDGAAITETRRISFAPHWVDALP